MKWSFSFQWLSVWSLGRFIYLLFFSFFIYLFFFFAARPGQFLFLWWLMRMRMIVHMFNAMALHFGVRLTCQGHTPQSMVLTKSGNYMYTCGVGRHLPFFRNLWASTLTVASVSGWILVLQPPHWVHSTPTLGRGRSESKNPAMPLLGFEPRPPSS
jgi:hypothetical protein